MYISTEWHMNESNSVVHNHIVIVKLSSSLIYKL